MAFSCFVEHVLKTNICPYIIHLDIKADAGEELTAALSSVLFEKQLCEGEIIIHHPSFRPSVITPD